MGFFYGFMDTDGKNWVMKFLSEYEGTVIVISHDLKLMNLSLNKIIAILLSRG